MPLPECHSRRELPGRRGVFFCAHPGVRVPGCLVASTVCGICVRWKHPPPERFRPFDPDEVYDRSGPCVHLGEQMGLRECASCRGRVRVKVYACGHPGHSDVTLADCKLYADYRPLPAHAGAGVERPSAAAMGAPTAGDVAS